MIREYETVFLTQPNLPEPQHKQLVDKLKGMIEKHEGHIFFARSMGKRQLSYPIGKQTKAVYTCLDYASQGTAVSEIERSMRLDENVLRFLTVVKAEAVDIAARAAEIQARGEDVSLTSAGDAPPAEVRPVDEDSESEIPPAAAPKAGNEEV